MKKNIIIILVFYIFTKDQLRERQPGASWNYGQLGKNRELKMKWNSDWFIWLYEPDYYRIVINTHYGQLTWIWTGRAVFVEPGTFFCRNRNDRKNESGQWEIKNTRDGAEDGEEETTMKLV